MRKVWGQFCVEGSEGAMNGRRYEGKVLWREGAMKERHYEGKALWREGAMKGRRYEGKALWREGTMKGRRYEGKALWREGAMKGRHYEGKAVWREGTMKGRHYEEKALWREGDMKGRRYERKELWREGAMNGRRYEWKALWGEGAMKWRGNEGKALMKGKRYQFLPARFCCVLFWKKITNLWGSWPLYTGGKSVRELASVYRRTKLFFCWDFLSEWWRITSVLFKENRKLCTVRHIREWNHQQICKKKQFYWLVVLLLC